MVCERETMKREFEECIAVIKGERQRELSVHVYAPGYDPPSVHINDTLFGDTCFSVKEAEEVLQALTSAIRLAKSIPVMMDEDDNRESIQVYTSDLHPVAWSGGYIGTELASPDK